jgi:hypothetical protein
MDDEPRDKPAGDSEPQSDDKPADNQPAQSDDKPAADQPTAQSDEKPADDQPTAQSDDKPAADQPTAQSDDKPAADQPTAQSDDKPADDQPTGQSDDKPADDSDKPAQPSDDKPADGGAGSGQLNAKRQNMLDLINHWMPTSLLNPRVDGKSVKPGQDLMGKAGWDKARGQQSVADKAAGKAVATSCGDILAALLKLWKSNFVGYFGIRDAAVGGPGAKARGFYVERDQLGPRSRCGEVSEARRHYCFAQRCRQGGHWSWPCRHPR